MIITPSHIFWKQAIRTQLGFFQEGQSQYDVHADEQSDDESKRQKNYIVCRVCRNIITEPVARIAVQGSHKHVFFNPMGIVFEIGCFSNVFGCECSGHLTYEYTWFDGYAWNICLCSMCSSHLGWFYQSAGSASFYGLILSQLEEGASP
jgi:hypothetical protein